MRLCIIANPNSIHTQRWVSYFAGRGHDVHLIGHYPVTATLPGNIEFHDLTHYTNRRKFRFVVWSQALRRLLRTIRPDVLHAHQVTGSGWLGAASGYHPFVVTSWGSDLLVSAQRSPTQRRLASLVLRRADYVTCVSQPLAEAALALGADPRHLEVVYWGVDRDIFHAKAAKAEDLLGRGEQTAGEGAESSTVLSIRAIRPLYNPLVIAHAIPLVLAERPEARFVIRTYSYDASLLAEFRSLIEASGASDAVEYVGDLPDDDAIADLYRRAGIAISVPSSDGTPQSVLEAMACGAVPVLSDLPWLNGWIRNEGEALVVPAGDAPALARAIVRLLADPTLRNRLRASALEMVRARADSAIWMARTETIYHRLVAAAPRSGQGKD